MAAKLQVNFGIDFVLCYKNFFNFIVRCVFLECYVVWTEVAEVFRVEKQPSTAWLFAKNS